jgi:Spy/CpxP family protein refolding chaperone
MEPMNMTNIRKPALFAAALTAMVALASPVASMAQSTYDDTQQLLTQIQTDKRAIVLKGMALDDAQVQAFTPIYDEYQVDRKKLMERSVDLINAYASNYDTMTDDAAKKLLKDWFKLQEDEDALVKKYAKRFEKVLPATKVLRFVQIENKLNTIVRSLGVRTIPLAQ